MRAASWTRESTAHPVRYEDFETTSGRIGLILLNGTDTGWNGEVSELVWGAYACSGRNHLLLMWMEDLKGLVRDQLFRCEA